jgi:predicted RNA methylase
MQAHLFGEPERKPSLSQWFTPPFLAQRLAGWVPRGSRVLEPSCGRGALLEALLRAGHPALDLHGIELDPAWAAHCRERFPGVSIDVGDFFEQPLEADSCDVVAMNPPFEDNGHLRFVLRALELAPVVVGIFPVSFEFSGQRDRELWIPRGVVTRRARLPERVDYGGTQSPSFDSVALRIERRFAPRARHDRQLVVEEVWTQ